MQDETRSKTISVLRIRCDKLVWREYETVRVFHGHRRLEVIVRSKIEIFYVENKKRNSAILRVHRLFRQPTNIDKENVI